MTHTTDAVTHSVLVPLAPDAAFRLFTERFGEWWPADGHHILDGDDVEVFLDAREGGRWHERRQDGAEYDWGFVKEVEPPGRILIAWHLTPDWEFDPDPAKATEVEVTFAAEGEGTRVTLEHRGFEVHGEKAGEMRSSLDSGWPSLLALLRDAA